MTKIDLKSKPKASKPRSLDFDQLRALVDRQAPFYKRTGILMQISIMDLGFRFSFSKSLMEGGDRIKWNHIIPWVLLERSVLSIGELADHIIDEAEARFANVEKKSGSVDRKSGPALATFGTCPDVPIWERGIRGEC